MKQRCGTCMLGGWSKDWTARHQKENRRCLITGLWKNVKDRCKMFYAGDALEYIKMLKKEHGRKKQ